MSPQLIQIESSPDLVDQVYRSLLDAVSDGSLAPAARIGQEDRNAIGGVALAGAASTAAVEKRRFFAGRARTWRVGGTAGCGSAGANLPSVQDARPKTSPHCSPMPY